MKDIQDYTLNQFIMFLRAAEEVEASERLSFVSDMAAVVGSLFSESKPSPMETHVNSLSDMAAGARDGK